MNLRLWLAAVLLGTACIGHAAETAAARLNGILQGMSSMQADFSQRTYDAKGTALQNLYGSMQVKRPGYFRWETTRPFPQLITANGSKVWVYDPELEQVTVQMLDKQVGNTPALLLSGDPKKLGEAFSISDDGGKASEEAFLLKPKARDALFESLRVTFNGRQLTSMHLRDSLGQKTEIHFSKIVLNPNLPNSLFVFEPPKGVDVINEL